MKANDIRNWLGIYFLATTVFCGAYILLFSQTRLLPIKQTDCEAAFQIMIPFFVAQLTIIFKWISGDQKLNSQEIINIPKWAVIGPPAAVTFIFLSGVVFMIVTGFSDTGSAIDGARFKSIVTFCIAILNASTIFIIMKLFGGSEQQQDRHEEAIPPR